MDTHYKINHPISTDEFISLLESSGLGPRCKLILIAAPRAHSYYDRIGFTHNNRCWVLNPDQPIGE